MQLQKQVTGREFWADKLMDLANFSATILVLSQFVASKRDWRALTSGVIIYALLVIMSWRFLNEDKS